MANRLSNNIIFQRLPIAITTFLLSAYLAKLMGAAEYGQIAFAIFFIKNLPSMNFGVSYGFLFFHYNSQEQMRDSYLICFFLFSMLFLILGAVFVNPIVLLLGFFVAPFYIIDPILRTRGTFISSFIPEILLLVSICLSYLIKPDDIKLLSMILTFCFSGAFFYLFKGKLKFLFNSFKIPKTIQLYENCKTMVKKGFQSYLQLALIFSFLFMDRYLASVYFSKKDLGNYMLAFQFVQGALFILTSLNIPNLTKIGEEIRNDTMNKETLKRTLKQNVYLGICSLIIVFVGLLIIKPYYFSSFDRLLEIYLVISPGLFAMTVIGSVSPVLFYCEKQGLASFSLIFSIFFIVINYLASAHTHLDYKSILIMNYGVLMVSSIFIIRYAVFVLDKRINYNTSLTI